MLIWPTVFACVMFYSQQPHLDMTGCVSIPGLLHGQTVASCYSNNSLLQGQPVELQPFIADSATAIAFQHMQFPEVSPTYIF